MSNMYPNVITWNPVGGECRHKCSYCYRNDMMRTEAAHNKYSGEPRLWVVKEPRSKNMTVFVCSMTDLFASDVPGEVIIDVLARCRKASRYLLQSKNPARMLFYKSILPDNAILGTTIETSEENMYETEAPSIQDRYSAMVDLRENTKHELMVSIEPIMDFTFHQMMAMMLSIKPDYISIGADSKRKNLHEPSRDKIEKLINELQKITEVRVKSNLSRLGVRDV